MMRKYAPNSVSTSLGRLDQTKQGQRSTRRVVESDGMKQSSAPESADPTKAVFVQVYRATGRKHMDAAGRFPIPSHKGNQYILVMYGEDFNFIHAEPLRSRDKQDIMRGIERGLKLFATDGDVPTIWRIDNECSGEIKETVPSMTSNLN